MSRHNESANFFRCIMLMLTLLALAMQILTAMSCSLVELINTDVVMGVFFDRGTDGQCNTEVYQTEDPFTKAARSALVISTFAGAAAGLLMTTGWFLCEICCAGCLEGMAYFVAWAWGAFTFLFYGAEVCQRDAETMLKGYGMNLVYSAFGDEGGEDVLKAEGGGQGCKPSQASHFMTVAVICYLACGILHFCAPRPDPLMQQA